MQQYTAKKGYYRKRELSLLATSLGFPGSLLVSRFHGHYTVTEDHTREDADGAGGKVDLVSEKMIIRLLNSGALFKRLEKVFNIYPAWYNIKLIRKAMQHVRHRSLSFSDISDCRRAFELHAYEDGSGIPAELSHVRQALKVLERIMSPSRLQMEIQRFNDVSDVPSRLQLYEFMDIVAMCGKTEVEEERRLSEISISESTNEVNNDLSVPDFCQILMTTDQKMSAYLESNYQESLHKGKESPTPPRVHTLDHIVHTDSRKSLVSLASEQSRAVTPCLENSQSQLHRSRNGYYSLSDENFKWIHANSRQPSPTKLSSKLLSKAEDPLTKKTENSRLVSQKPVRVRLQHLPQRKPVTIPPIPKFQLNKDSERLRKTINDTCADSVLKARGTLQSSLFTISPPHPHQSTHQLPEAVNTRITMSTPKTTPESASVNRNHRHVQFHEDPIVTEEERKDQQELIDGLMWSTRKSKVGYHLF